MRQENNTTAPEAHLTDAATPAATAFEYLKSLPRNLDRPALDSYKKGKDSAIIDHEVAEDFTNLFRASAPEFTIPVSWTMTKTSLINLLGITDYEGYEEVNGVRFYAGLNGDNQLTLIAVSTKVGLDGNDDLTVADAYPYYDFCDPCPNNCSRSGNLKVNSGLASARKFKLAP